MAMVVVALTKRLHLKPARQDSTAKIHRRSGAWSALLDIQAQNQRQNVTHGKYIFIHFFSEPSSFHFFIFLTRYILIHSFSFSSSISTTQRQGKVQLQRWQRMLRVLTGTLPRSEHHSKPCVQRLSSRIRQHPQWFLVVL